MLLLLIGLIVGLKHSTSRLLGRAGELWGPPPAGVQPPRPGSGISAPLGDFGGRAIRLGPGLAPRPTPVNPQ
jgi:hypothetical protein